MLSLISPKPLPLSVHRHPLVTQSISASAASQPPPRPSSIPISPQPLNLYQPFRPPPSPLPSKFRSLDTTGKIEILSNRLGLWFEYAPLISSLSREGFPPSTIEELTGISGVEQNLLVVAAQVRDSLADPPAAVDPNTLSYFDSGGAELLYEIRLLSAAQRAAAARYLVGNRLDGKGARDVARAIKDFPMRKGDPGWECFDFNLPGDCLSFMYFRQSKEHRKPSEKRTTALEAALEVAESERAATRVREELEGKGDGKKGGEGGVDAVRVPVVRMKVGEVAEANKVVVFPVCKAEESENGVTAAPSKCRSEGEFGVVTAEKAWERWVVLPGWEPVAAVDGGGVAVEFWDARVLPWRVNRWYKEEPILVVADRGRKEVIVEDGFYLVVDNGSGGGGGGGDGRINTRLKVERGVVLKEKAVYSSLGMVVLVVRPPKDEVDDQLNNDDWE